VGAVIGDDSGRIVVIQRGQPPSQWLWSLPGGRVEPGETHEAAVVREVREETGLDVAVTGVLGVVELPGVGDVVYAVTDYSGRVTATDAHPPTAGDDAADARWVSRDEFDALDTSPGLAEALASWDIWR
jgi:ADP-ribose pyrophosphatase YjhB (NUDIX family)